MRLIWGIVPLALVGVLYLQWAGWPPPPDWQLASTGAVRGDADPQLLAEIEPLARPEVPPDRSAYAEVIERPLFLPDRRPPEPEAADGPTASAQEAAALETLDLVAVIMTPDLTTAWVKDAADPKLIQVQTGEDLAGWTVREIRPDRVALEREGRAETLLLRTFPVQPAAPAPPHPGERRRARMRPPSNPHDR